MNQDIIELQMKVSFQDGLLEDLNQVVIEQQKQISTLELAIQTLKVQMQTMQTQSNQTVGETHEIPPHY